MFDILEADIVIMQETKIQRKDLQDDMVLVPGWDVYFSLPKHKKGESDVQQFTYLFMLMRLHRVFWGRHLHSLKRLFPNPSRRGNYWHSLPPWQLAKLF